jgi:hypothetical protein
MRVRFTVTDGAPARRQSERGAALVFALLGLATLTILGLGLTSVGMLGTKMTVAERDTQEALALADAGLAHARKMITYKEWDWPNLSPFLTSGNGTACDGDELFQAPTVPVTALPLPTGAGGYPTHFIGRAIDGGTTLGTGTYRVFVCDDDVTDLDTSVTPVVLNTDPNFDANRRIIVRSVGTTASGATATLEMVMGANAVPAVLINGNVLAGGSVKVMGNNGTIHSNGSMDIIGSNVCAQQEFEATGDVTGNPDGGATCDQPGEKRPGSAPVNVRLLTPLEFKGSAQYWLSIGFGGPGGSSPIVRTYSGGTWNVVSPTPTWVSSNTSRASLTLEPAAPKAIYYADANMEIGSNFLSECDPATPPVGYVSTETTILTEGWFDADGGAKICGKLRQLGLGRITVVAGTDIELGGNTGGSLPDPPPPMLAGLYYARHQVGTQGTPIIYGQVVALNLADTPFPASGTGSTNLVQLDAQGRMKFNGNGYINYSDGGMTTTAPLSWRECRPDAASVDPDPCGAHYGGTN